jgi:thymidylate synthase
MSSNKEEQQYLDIVKETIEDGKVISNRTGIDCHVIWVRPMRFDLSRSFPLLTTKRVFWRGVAEELIWFINGDTNAKHLSEKGIKIWNDNSSEKNLKAIAKRAYDDGETELGNYFNSLKEGDCGPVYGFNWRHFGAKYINCDTDYTGQGFDQIEDIIHRLKTKPMSRDIMLTSYDPINAKKCVLYPCHVIVHFMVDPQNRLHSHMFQRSCDMGLGVPFNIASYALLTCMIAHVCGFGLGEFVHTLGNTHVYSNHVEALQEQMKRETFPFPTLKIKRKVTSMNDWRFEDFELEDYKCHGSIKMDMAY